jgi:hypothetical protein
MNGPSIPYGTATNIAVGSDAIGMILSVIGTFLHLLSAYWFLGVILLGFAVEVALRIWARVRSI